MKYSQTENVIILEENGLKVYINYDKVIGLIDSEINNLEVYKEGIEDNKLYYFKKKNVTKENYIESLESIKKLLGKMFKEKPEINIFDYLEVTKKGKFKKNRVVNLATPLVGLFEDADYYKYISFLSLQTSVMDEEKVRVHFSWMNCDLNKFEPIFFGEYDKPIIREKMKAIRTADLKVGTIYSDEKQKKFYLYLGKVEDDSRAIYRESTSLLPESDFSDEEIEKNVAEIFKKEENLCLKYNEKYQGFKYAYIQLSKKDIERLKQENKTKDFEEFLKNRFSEERWFIDFSFYKKPLRLFHEEFTYLKDTKPLKLIKKECSFVDNVHGGFRCTDYPDYYTECFYNYLNFID